MAKGKSGSTTGSTSSGKRRMVRAKRNKRQVDMKIARWKRYQTEGKVSWTATQEKDGKSKNRSRYNNWDTAGLKRHSEHLQSVIDKGRKTRASASASVS